MRAKNRRIENRNREFEGLSHEERHKIIRARRKKEKEGKSSEEIEQLIRAHKVLTVMLYGARYMHYSYFKGGKKGC